MKKLTFLVIAVFGLITLANAQTSGPDAKLSKLFEKSMTIDKILALPDADFWKYSQSVLYQNQGFEDGHGIYAWPPAMKQFPKKVGLLSFIVFDPGFFEARVKNYGTMLTLRSYKGDAVSLDNTEQLTSFFYGETLPELKDNFKYFGSELLTPEEFCTTDAIREAYQNFSFKEKESAEWISKESKANTMAIPAGQHLYYAENLTAPAFVDAIGAKANQLGLDAVAILKIQFGIDEKGTICIQSINYGLYGSNPVPKNPDSKNAATNAAIAYHENQVFNAKKLGALDLDAMLKADKGLNVVVYAENKSGKIYKFDNIGKLINKVALGSNYELNMWIKGDWKPFKYE
ncbi:MAG: hypothetical protein HXX13_00645 [Bacteroidetes bacterium]|nr:hypothetical protein [Bacteroidota bacterium]